MTSDSLVGVLDMSHEQGIRVSPELSHTDSSYLERP